MAAVKFKFIMSAGAIHKVRLVCFKTVLKLRSIVLARTYGKIGRPPLLITDEPHLSKDATPPGPCLADLGRV